MTSVELFAGAGGLALGVSNAGFKHKAVVEIDRDACNTIRVNQRRGLQPVADWPLFEADVTGMAARRVYIPLDGGDVYITLHSEVDGAWTTREYRFATASRRTGYAGIRIGRAVRALLDATPAPVMWNLGRWVAGHLLQRAKNVADRRDTSRPNKLGGRRD